MSRSSELEFLLLVTRGRKHEQALRSDVLP